jgi:hypothetical protein
MSVAEIGICDCCQDRITTLYAELKALRGHELGARVRSDLLALGFPPEYILGMLNMIISETPKNLDDKGKDLFDLLVAYLYVRGERDETTLPSLWNFIQGYFHLPEDCGYDYFLLCFIDTHRIVDHGIAIRYVWLSRARNEYPPPSDAHRKIVTQWLDDKE